MKDITSCVRECFDKLSNSRVKDAVNIISSSAINAHIKQLANKEQVKPFVAVCKTLPSLTKILKKRSKVTIISNGENLPVPNEKNLMGCSSLNILGLQEFLIEPKIVKELNLKYVETLGLGEIRDDNSKVEPLLRESEYILLDMRSIKHSEFSIGNNPNGFRAEEICQIAHYTGCSLNLKGVIIYGLEKEAPLCCYNLVSQIIWLISNSRLNNIFEDPSDAYKKGGNSEGFQHKIVNLNNDEEVIVFITSLHSGRIWMEIPIVKKNKIILVPCSEFDYQQAIEDQIPNKWLIYYTKHNI